MVRREGGGEGERGYEMCFHGFDSRLEFFLLLLFLGAILLGKKKFEATKSSSF